MSQKSDKECEKEVGGKRELESLLSVLDPSACEGRPQVGFP